MRYFAIVSLAAFLAVIIPSFTDAQPLPSTPAAAASRPWGIVPVPLPAATSKLSAPSTTTVVPTPTQAWWQALLLALATAAVPVLTGMLVDLIKVLAKKYRLQIDAAKLDKIAEFAIGYVEQKIVRVAKAEGKPTPAAEAMAKAVELATAKAKELGYPEQTEKWWAEILESKLGGGGTPAGEPPSPGHGLRS